MNSLVALAFCVLCLGMPPSPVRSGLPGTPADTIQAVAPDAEILLNARTVAVIGVTGRLMMDRLWANPDGARARRKVEAVLTAWGRYEVIDAAENADLVLVVAETQKNLDLFRLANLVAHLEVYRGGAEITARTPSLWSGEAAEGFKKLPATKVAEAFRDYVKKLPARPGPTS